MLGLTALVTAAVIAFLPETLYFPVIEYTTPENIGFKLLKNGELDRSGCERGAHAIAQAIVASCPNCKVVERCIRGLDAERRKILSRAPLPTPSIRTRDGKVAMTISAGDPQLALSVCRASEQQGASKPLDQRPFCFPAFADR
ncbi:MAG: hypothetical protein ABIH03_07645 [Pseudomonadota bacterium]